MNDDGCRRTAGDSSVPLFPDGAAIRRGRPGSIPGRGCASVAKPEARKTSSRWPRWGCTLFRGNEVTRGCGSWFEQLQYEPNHGNFPTNGKSGHRKDGDNLLPRCRNIIDVTGLEAGDGHDLSLLRRTISDYAPVWQFSARTPDRRRRHGRGLSRPGRHAEPGRGGEGPETRTGLGPESSSPPFCAKRRSPRRSITRTSCRFTPSASTKSVYYMVVEYISGGSLDDKMTNPGRITELEGIEIGIAVARGLECALQRGADSSGHQAGQHSFQRQQHAQGGRFRPVAFV